MKIVVLDGYTLNPGDLDWGSISSLGDLTVYERSRTDEIVERGQGASILLTNKVIISQDILAELPDLKYIGVMATGYNIVDLQAASERGIIVTNVAGYSTAAVAQHTFALLLALVNRVEMHSELVHQGEWAKSKDFTFRKTPLIELAGKTIGLIGLGDIGQQVADIAKVFGMHVLAYRKNPSKTTDNSIKMVSLDDLLTQSDVVSLHAPLTADTEGLINKNSLSLMKQTAFLINTARGALIHEQDLAAALAERKIAGAGLDVLSVEPPFADNPLLSTQNCIITPHIAWSLKEARQRLMFLLSENIKAYQNGKTINQVNKI